MAIFTSIALNIYVSVLKYMYQKRDRFELRKAMAAARNSGPGAAANRTSTDSLSGVPLEAKKIQWSYLEKSSSCGL